VVRPRGRRAGGRRPSAQDQEGVDVPLHHRASSFCASASKPAALPACCSQLALRAVSGVRAVLPRRYPFGVVDAPPHSSLRLAQLLTVCGCIIGMPLMYLYMKKKHFETHYIGEPARWVARRRSLTDRRPHPSAAWVAAGTMVLLTIPIALLGVRSRRDVRSHTCAGTPRVRQPPLF
jgi:hypothetical protein